MKKISLLGAIIALVFTGQAQARTHHHVRTHRAHRAPDLVCPVSAPTQSFTVVNDAYVPRGFLAKVERAVVDQSSQVRAYWHSPCASFVPSGGWPVYVEWSATQACDLGGAGSCHGPQGVVDYQGVPTIPTIYVSVHDTTGDESWTVDFSHEIVETLVDPYVTRSDSSDGSTLEICDATPYAYRLGGVWVSDFTLPAFWSNKWTAHRWDYLKEL